MGRYLGWLVAILLLLVVFSGAGSAAFAGPVDWHEVASSSRIATSLPRFLPKNLPRFLPMICLTPSPFRGSRAA